MSCGAPHFSSLAKRSRHSNYTFPKVLFELFDFPITKAKNIELKTQIDDNDTLQEIRVSDDYEFGFENIHQTGANNPLNMGHTKESHNDDLETSEFGTGMKSGSLSAANELRVITRVVASDGNPRYFEVLCDFIHMASQESVELSYNPMIREITYGEYKRFHPFDCGSTIILSKIRNSIYPRTKQEDITKDMISHLSSTYDRIIRIRNVNIEVNRVKVIPAYDFFADLKCIPFIVTKWLWVIEKDGNQRDYVVKRSAGNQATWSQYNRRENKWNKISEVDAEDLINVVNNGNRMPYSPIDESGACLILRTVFTFYSEKFHYGEDTELPSDALLIYKANRKYGKESLFDHRNGTHNYTLHEMDFISKQMGKDIGITFNKDIQLNGKNELIMAIQSALEDNKVGITADTSTGSNAKLCEKAIKMGVLDPETCPPQKLAVKFRQAESASGSDTESGNKISVKTRKPRSSKKASPVVVSPPAPSPPVVVQSAMSTLNAWFPEEIVASEENSNASTPTIEEAQESENLPEIEEKEEPINLSEIRRRRAIDIIVRLQKMVADEMELSEEALSAIESAIA